MDIKRDAIGLLGKKIHDRKIELAENWSENEFLQQQSFERFVQEDEEINKMYYQMDRIVKSIIQRGY